MSRADEIFIRNCRDILDNGIWDTDRPVRPKWDDGQSAHTIKKFGIINRYNLAEEFPILTLRRTPIGKNGKRKTTLRIFNAQITAFFFNMLQYAEQVRRAICNRTDY